MAPLNAGGCSRAQTRTFCQHFKTILGHFAAFSRSWLRLPGQAEQHSGVKSNSIPGTERRVSSSPSALSALLRDVLPELENAAKCSRIVLKCGQNVRVCAREQPPALSGAIWNQHLQLNGTDEHDFRTAMYGELTVLIDKQTRETSELFH